MKHVIGWAHYKFILINYLVQWFRVAYSKEFNWILPPQLHTSEQKSNIVFCLEQQTMDKVFQKSSNKNKRWYWNLWCSMWIISLSKKKGCTTWKNNTSDAKVSGQSWHIHWNVMHLLHMTCHHTKPLQYSTDHLLKGRYGWQCIYTPQLCKQNRPEKNNSHKTIK